MTTTIVQLSDTHIREAGRLAYGRVDTAAFLELAVQSVLALRQAPDAVVVTGDLVDFGRPAEYARLRQLLAPLTMPLYLLPGNHDDRAMLRAGFADHDYLQAGDPDAFVQYAVTIGELRLVTLDTLVPRASHGALCEHRLDWLDETLEAQAGAPVLVAMHHPPFTTLIGHMDDIGLLEGSDELEAVIRRYPNVERLICGHLHRAIEARFGGTIASTAPGPAHQVSLDLAPDAQSTFTMEPPAFRIHVWTPETGLLTHLAPVGRFDGPYPFHEPGGALID